ncbi:MAG: hypothetical protein V3T88_02780 [Nitrosomonadaceae bacterium]
MGNTVVSKRVDDAFLRKVIWVLLTTILGLGGAFVWLFYQVQANTSAVKEIHQLQKTMNNINIGVVRLVENSNIRNELMKNYAVKQDYIFGEQKRRTSTIKRANEHIDNYQIHGRYRK